MAVSRANLSRPDVAGKQWAWTQYFPVVVKDAYIVRTESIIYSSFPVDNRTYRLVPGGNNSDTWNIDEVLCTDASTFAAVLSCLDLTRPSSGSFISTSFKGSLSGCSLGLALCLCCIGAPPIASTGFISSVGPSSTNEGAVEPVDHLVRKITHFKDSPLIVPLKAVLSGDYGIELKNMFEAGRFYTCGDLYAAKPYNPNLYVGIATDTLSDAVLLAQCASPFFSPSVAS